VRDIDLRQGCPRATEKKPEMGLIVPSHTFGSDQWLAVIGNTSNHRYVVCVGSRLSVANQYLSSKIMPKEAQEITERPRRK
jgi:hypothetical protein